MSKRGGKLVCIHVDIVIDYDLLDPLAGYQTGGEEDQLLSLEKLRASPELWPEQSKFYSHCLLLLFDLKNKAMGDQIG